MNYCPKCGEKTGGYKFCPKCGYNLNQPLKENTVQENPGLAKKLMIIDLILLLSFVITLVIYFVLMLEFKMDVSWISTLITAPLFIATLVISIMGKVKFRNSKFFLIMLILSIVIIVGVTLFGIYLSMLNCFTEMGNGLRDSLLACS